MTLQLVTLKAVSLPELLLKIFLKIGYARFVELVRTISSPLRNNQLLTCSDGCGRT